MAQIKKEVVKVDKKSILQFAGAYAQRFKDPKYNPYDFENYIMGLQKLGFKPTLAAFASRHPEIRDEDGDVDANSIAVQSAIAKETDLVALGSFVMSYALAESKSAWSADAVDYKWHIKPLERLAALCKQ